MRPTRHLVRALAAVTVLALAAGFRPVLVPAWIASMALLAAWMLHGLVAARGMGQRLTVTRRLPLALPLGTWNGVALQFEWSGARPLAIEAWDEHPEPAETTGQPGRVILVPGLPLELRYRLRPLRRGAAGFGRVQVLADVPGRAWRRRIVAGEGETVRVYPNFAAVSEYALLAAAGRTGQLGIRRYRRRGEGLELHQLREYRPGDTLRQVDWKATARRGQPISREYQDESSQQVLFLLDCGRRMRSQDGELSHFDHALDALLLVSYVALRAGDLVGLRCFGGVERHLAPLRGRGAMKAVLNAVHDLQPTLEVPDYVGLAAAFSERVRRRALVILVTNLRDEDASDVEAAVRLLRRRHVVVVASLRETVLGTASTRPVRELDDALRAGAAQLYLEDRRRAHERLAGTGAAIVDVEPANLTVTLVNRYLEIKSRG